MAKGWGFNKQTLRRAKIEILNEGNSGFYNCFVDGNCNIKKSDECQIADFKWPARLFRGLMQDLQSVINGFLYLVYSS
jgi:hypothetical protein